MPKGLWRRGKEDEVPPGSAGQGGVGTVQDAMSSPDSSGKKKSTIKSIFKKLSIKFSSSKAGKDSAVVEKVAHPTHSAQHEATAALDDASAIRSGSHSGSSKISAKLPAKNGRSGLQPTPPATAHHSTPGSGHLSFTEHQKAHEARASFKRSESAERNKRGGTTLPSLTSPANADRRRSLDDKLMHGPAQEPVQGTPAHALRGRRQTQSEAGGDPNGGAKSTSPRFRGMSVHLASPSDPGHVTGPGHQATTPTTPGKSRFADGHIPKKTPSSGALRPSLVDATASMHGSSPPSPVNSLPMPRQPSGSSARFIHMQPVELLKDDADAGNGQDDHHLLPAINSGRPRQAAPDPGMFVPTAPRAPRAKEVSDGQPRVARQARRYSDLVNYLIVQQGMNPLEGMHAIAPELIEKISQCGTLTSFKFTGLDDVLLEDSMDFEEDEGTGRVHTVGNDGPGDPNSMEAIRARQAVLAQDLPMLLAAGKGQLPKEVVQQMLADMVRQHKARRASQTMLEQRTHSGLDEGGAAAAAAGGASRPGTPGSASHTRRVSDAVQSTQALSPVGSPPAAAAAVQRPVPPQSAHQGPNLNDVAQSLANSTAQARPLDSAAAGGRPTSPVPVKPMPMPGMPVPPGQEEDDEDEGPASRAGSARAGPAQLPLKLIFSRGPNGTPMESTSPVQGYIVSKAIGEGGFCQVRLGMHHLTHRKVAIKVIDRVKLSDEKEQRRIAREIKVLKHLDHEAIIRLFEVQENPTKQYIIMEFAPGGSLLDYVRSRRRLSETDACFLFQQIVAGLQHCHSREVVHRDVKLENILLDVDNKVKIIDFGLSAFYSPGKPLRVHCGSPSYAAPEIIGRKWYEGPPVDVWSLGVVLFAMVCGYLPFHASGSNKQELCNKIMAGTYTCPEWVSPPLRDLLQRMLTVDPAIRVTLSQVWHHPWVKGAVVRWQPLGSSLFALPVDPNSGMLMADGAILNELASRGVPPELVMQRLQAKSFDYITAAYFLLSEQKAELNRRAAEAQGQRNRGLQGLSAYSVKYRQGSGRERRASALPY